MNDLEIVRNMTTTKDICERINTFLLEAPPFVFEPGTQKELSKKEYHETLWWKDLKAKRMEKANHCCEFCGKAITNGELHHRTYSTYGFREDIDDVRIVCRECHEEFHQYEWSLKEILRHSYVLNLLCDKRKREMYLNLFIQAWDKDELINGGNYNFCDVHNQQPILEKFTQVFGESDDYHFLDIQSYYTMQRYIEIDKMIISGYVSGIDGIGWNGISSICNVSQNNIRTYKSNMYENKTNNILKGKILGGKQMKPIDLSNVPDNNRLTAGGYVCKYTLAEDKPEKEYLYMEYDIAEGQHKDYYKNLEKTAGFWGGKIYRSYKPTAQPMFKRMCKAINSSNPGFIFDGGAQNCDESTLVGKYVGLVFGEEEYLKNNGDIGTRLYVYTECSIDDIRNCNFKVPSLKRLPGEKKATGTEDFVSVGSADSDFLPFN